MKIAHLGSLCIPVPPADYGGTERAIAQISVFQAATRGHDVTVYASADSPLIEFAAKISTGLGLGFSINGDQSKITISNTSGNTGSLSLRHNGMAALGFKDDNEKQKDTDFADLLIADDRVDPFEIVQCHVPALSDHLLSSSIGHKMLTHLHGNGLNKDYKENPYPVICISSSQANTIKNKFNAKVAGVVLHGIDTDNQPLYEEHAGYLAWIGRIIDKKGTHVAIEIARRAGKPLIIAGTTYGRSTLSADYFSDRIEPLIDYTDQTLLDKFHGMNTDEIKTHLKNIQAKTGSESPVVFVGPANEIQKQTLLGNAQATLFPILWSEPFGLVMIESMAGGTPVIAPTKVGNTECGSVQEVIENGVTGFSFETADEDDLVVKSVEAVLKADLINRKEIHENFKINWSSQRVAADLDVTYCNFIERAPVSPFPNVARDMK